MTYAELYDAVAKHLDHGMTYAIEVQTWCHGREPETEWSIYVTEHHKHYVGPTAQRAFELFLAGPQPEIAPQKIDETSADVGDAL